MGGSVQAEGSKQTCSQAQHDLANLAPVHTWDAWSALLVPKLSLRLLATVPGRRAPAMEAAPLLPGRLAPHFSGKRRATCCSMAL